MQTFSANMGASSLTASSLHSLVMGASQAPNTSLRYLCTLATESIHLKVARFRTSSSSGPGWRLPVGCRETQWVSEKAVTEPVANIKTQGQYESNFTDLLLSISEMHTEVGEEGREAEEYLQNVEGEAKGRTTGDYYRRAYLYGKSAEILAARKRKGEKVNEDLEQLQGVVLEEDNGRSPGDYRRRAELFSKSAEVFGSHAD